MIKKGDRFVCIKDVVENGDIYLKGKTYKSDRDECITDESGYIDRCWGLTDTLNEYFVPASGIDIVKKSDIDKIGDARRSPYFFDDAVWPYINDVMKNNVFVYYVGNKERSKEIEKALIRLGGTNNFNVYCVCEDDVYYINGNGSIDATKNENNFITTHYTEAKLPQKDENVKLEDTCLTIEQVLELKDLGFEFKDTALVYCNCDNRNYEYVYKLMINREDVEIGALSVIPTLTNTEMYNMFPDLSCIEKDNGWLIWNRSLEVEEEYYKPLLRDSLFEMLKYLKINKFI